MTSKLLAKCRPYLVHLNLRGCNRITSNTFHCVRQCRNLQDLNLSECNAVNVSTLHTRSDRFSVELLALDRK